MLWHCTSWYNIYFVDSYTLEDRQKEATRIFLLEKGRAHMGDIGIGRKPKT
jgi:hypothetical protein